MGHTKAGLIDNVGSRRPGTCLLFGSELIYSCSARLPEAQPPADLCDPPGWATRSCCSQDPGRRKRRWAGTVIHSGRLPPGRCGRDCWPRSWPRPGSGAGSGWRALRLTLALTWFQGVMFGSPGWVLAFDSTREHLKKCVVLFFDYFGSGRLRISQGSQESA